MATTIETIRLLTVRGREEGMSGLAQALQRVNAGQMELAKSGQLLTQTTVNLTQKQIDTTRAYEGLQRRLDPHARAWQQFARDLRLVNEQFDKSQNIKQYTRDVEALQAQLVKAGALQRQVFPSTPQQRINTMMGIGAKPATEQGATFGGLAAVAERDAAAEDARVQAEIDAAVAARQAERAGARSGPSLAEMNADQRRFASEQAAKEARAYQEVADALNRETAEREESIRVAMREADQIMKMRAAAQSGPRMTLGELEAGDRRAAAEAAAIEAREYQKVADAINQEMAARERANAELEREMQLFSQMRAVAFRNETGRPTIALSDLQAGDRAAAATMAANEAKAYQRIADEVNESIRAKEQAIAVDERLTRRATELLHILNPLTEAQDRYNKEIAEFLALQKAGKLTGDQVAGLSQMSVRRLEEAERAVRAFGQSAAFSRLQFINLGYQLNDVVSGLAMGQSPFMILTQQGGQILQVMSTARGGVRGAMSELTGMFVRMVTPARLAFAGIAAGAAAAGAAIYGAYQDQLKLEGALLGRGRGSGASTLDLRNIGSAAAGPGMSIAQGREAAMAFAETGKIGVDMMLRLTQASKDYAATTRQDLTDAVKELAGVFGGDLVQGADAINARLGFLDDKTRQYIRTLQLQGNRQQAQDVLFRAMRENIVESTTRLTALGRAWEAVGNFASNAWQKAKDAAAGMFAVDEAMERATELTAAKANLEAAKQGGYSPFQGQQLGSGQRAPLGVSAAVAAQQQQRIRDAEARVAAAQAAVDKANAVAAQVAEAQKTADASLKVGEVVRQTDAYSTAVNKLKDDLAVLNQTAANKALRESVADQAALERSIARTTDTLQRYLPEQEKKQKLDALNQRIAQTQNPSPALRAQWEAERTALEQNNELLTQNEVATNSNNQAKTKLLEIEKQITAQQQSTLRGLDREISMQKVVIAGIGQTTEEQDRAKITEQLLAQASEEALLQGITLNEKYVAALKVRAAEQAKLNAIEAQNRLGNDILFERDQLGRTTMEQEAASRTRGMDPLSAQTQFLQQQIMINRVLQDTGELTKEAFSGFVSDIRSGVGATEALNNVVIKLQDRLIQMAIDMVWAKALGLIGGAVTGAFGGSAAFTAPSGMASSVVTSMHLGGVVGQGSASGMRAVPSHIFHGAPRLHNGLRQDEFPALLQKGERVIPKGGAANDTLEIHIHGGGEVAKTKTSTNERGQPRLDVFMKAIEDKIAGDFANRGRLSRTLETHTNVVRKRGG